jgi:uncharacterized protein (TIGR00730 family)
MSGIRRICVYCGANAGARPAYAAAARRLGRLLGARGLGLVYGGGNVGLMGVLADAALAAGAEVLGVIPRALVARELGHQGITELRVVETMHERKAVMAELADAFVALPGGLGTLDELFEVMTWAQLGLHGKPIGLLEVEGFFAPLVAYLDRAVAEGFIRTEHRAALTVATEPEALLEQFATHRPQSVGKWLGRDIR